MDQEDSLDFKALRAKFQDEELLLTQHKIRPALPDKPKVEPLPQSPTHHLPAGARPSLLTSISQSMDGKTNLAPRVVFKNEMKESKNPLIQATSKGNDNKEGKLKFGKDKTKGSKERLDGDSSYLKPKKDKKLPAPPKVSTAELVPATPPPKATASKKMGFLNLKKSLKRDSLNITTDPILDTPSSDIPGTAPLIPVTSDFGDRSPEPKISAPKAILTNFPTSPDSSTTMETAPPFIIPASPDFTQVPAVIPDVPAPAVLDSETPLEIETPATSLSRPDIPPSVVLTPAASHSTSAPAPAPRVLAAEAATEAVNIAAVETPPPVTDPPSILASPKTGRTISPLSALVRAEDMNPGKRSPADQRIFNALEKARKKIGSPLTNHSTSYSTTPPPEELPPPESPTHSLPQLPPIDYEDRAGKAQRPKAKQVNGIDHRQASPVLEGISEEGSAAPPERFVVPPPPPRMVLPHPEALGPAPEKPARPPYVNLSEFIPPPPEEDDDIAVPLEFSDTDTTDVPEFDDVPSAAHSPELPVSEWGNGEYTGPHTVDGHNLPEFSSNGITAPGAEVHAVPALGDEYQDDPQAVAGLEAAEAANGISVSTENNYEDVLTSATKKKGKSEGGKKRKGPPKNPYAVAAQAANEEKSKTGRFGKSDKKVVAEGPDEKELKKKEKQRLEKEKKELKERQEREKKEQKEREKKENEMRKKFKITGQEDAMYQATVTVTTKGRKDDLLVGSGDVISIIRTTNCPKGKWLARDSGNNYGYIAVDHVELDIKEMLELGKRAANTHKTSSNVTEGQVTSTGRRASNHYPLSAESFTDDSEEWTGDEDDNLSPVQQPADPFAPAGHTRTLSMPDIGNKDLNIVHQHSQSDLSADGPHVQARHEALQKLATFFHSPKPVEPASSNNEPETSSIPGPVLAEEETDHVSEVNETEETDFDLPEMLILPPPDLYADMTME
ncbi:arginine-glutamic acid dipeptide repeats protein isoform X1 [Scophthalmus maximus]|uniref:arginine-glutamic acid dipeptide repeats protein isoform X1 n=1 Tax=Scophthalmus maximus TaxID=52904 RepID=UPI001FA8F02E|nr:arginine-glutamic acid dipeptide repeats protein isoform X1 [Scophthalmus maximus]